MCIKDYCFLLPCPVLSHANFACIKNELCFRRIIRNTLELPYSLVCLRQNLSFHVCFFLLRPCNESSCSTIQAQLISSTFYRVSGNENDLHSRGFAPLLQLRCFSCCSWLYVVVLYVAWLFSLFRAMSIVIAACQCERPCFVVFFFAFTASFVKLCCAFSAFVRKVFGVCVWVFVFN